MKLERPTITLQPTALVHEAFLKLVGPRIPLGRGSPFFRGGGRSHAQILVWIMQGQRASKRGGKLAREAVNLADVAAIEKFRRNFGAR